MTVEHVELLVEDAALTWLEVVGYTVLSRPAIAVGQPAAEQLQIGRRT
jgi:hypothetical protein